MTQDTDTHMTTAQGHVINGRLIALETRDAVDLVHRQHIEGRLDQLDTKLAAIGTKVDEGFEKVYASLRKPVMVVVVAFILALVGFVVKGGLAI
jgi:membrane-bound ClpP family serine protease